MSWDSGTFKHDIGTYAPVDCDMPIWPWSPRLHTVDRGMRAQSGVEWRYRHFQYPAWTLHFVDVGSICVNRIEQYVRQGTDGFYYEYDGNRYHVLPPVGYVWAPQADGPEIWTFDLPLECTSSGTLEIMAT